MITPAVLGIDTSCYTTSLALVDTSGNLIHQKRKLLTVSEGERGLQQSQALFQHTINLPLLMDELMKSIDVKIVATAASVTPRPHKDSYMPVFLAGRGYARGISAILKVPFYETTHQQGHIRAALVGSGLDSSNFLAFHLSGGTTEILKVTGNDLDIELLGGSSDLHAGQFVDRVGVALGLDFPAGPKLEELATCRITKPSIKSSVMGLSCSFSGAESQIQRTIAGGNFDKNMMASEVFSLLERQITKLIINAYHETGISNVLLAGGVASSGLLRRLIMKRLDKSHEKINLYWAEPQLSGDNSVGVALIGLKKLRFECIEE